MEGLCIEMQGSFVLLASRVSSSSSKDHKSVRALINLYYELAVMLTLRKVTVKGALNELHGIEYAFVMFNMGSFPTVSGDADCCGLLIINLPRAIYLSLWKFSSITFFQCCQFILMWKLLLYHHFFFL